MTRIGNCERCGTELRGGGLRGMCPRCLMELAAKPSPEAVPAASAPSLDELRALFPQLDVLELIGRGGMGAVYKARQRELDRSVALKILPPQVQADPSFAERFEREARALARLDHPGVVRVYDAGRAGGRYYVLMEYVDGVDLRRMLRNERIAPREALAIVAQVCDALQYAHDQGIVHRDIKPENILVDRRGRVRIADFGLAKMLGQSPAEFTLTRSDQAMGTLHYMAPEQMERPLSVDHRADIFSLGVVFYELLTGELPLGRFQPPSAKVAVDVRLDEVVLRALEKEPERRFQHASDVRIAVDAASQPSEAARAASNARGFDALEEEVVHAVEGALDEPEELEPRGAARGQRRRGPWGWVLGCGCLMLVPLLALLFLLPARMVAQRSAAAEAHASEARSLAEIQAEHAASAAAASALRFDEDGPRLSDAMAQQLAAKPAALAAANAVLRRVHGTYLALESAHVKSVLRPNGVLDLSFSSFREEVDVLELELWAGLASVFTAREMRTLRESLPARELLPFGREPLDVHVSRNSDGSFHIDERRPAENRIEIYEVPRLPERLERFWREQ